MIITLPEKTLNCMTFFKCYYITSLVLIYSEPGSGASADVVCYFNTDDDMNCIKKRALNYI